ncbi:MAG: porin [Bacteroidetes bacterium]|nr:porin [Bacteroidota bacterium]
MNSRILTAMAVLVFCVKFSIAQEVETPMIPEVVDTLNGKIENAKSDIDLLKRIKVTGYMQAQWQLADTIGAITTYSGGNFPKYSDNRFAIRRGRIKFTYDNEFSQYVLQLDATEKGVGIKDAYVAVKEPWFQFVTLTTGVFNRPFGYEITYSSSVRETPERARIFQVLFPGERDLGSMITLQPKKGSRFEWIKLDAGLFSGNGINGEFDKHKDFIGHLGVAKSNKAETFKIGLGLSYYNGGVFQGTKKVYSLASVVDDTLTNAMINGFKVDSTAGNKYEFAKRSYFGVDFQASYFSAIGISSVRAEYIVGKQPGGSSSNTSISSSTAPDYDTYLRNVSGGYIYLIQNIGQSKHQLVLKYDWMDPNTKVAGTDIKTKTAAGKSTGLSNADIKYTTLGLGWNYKFNSQVKFSAYYEMVKNEKTGIKGTNSTNDYTKDLKDNVLTLRVQYRF